MHDTLSPRVRDALDRCDLIATCFKAISDLMMPENDLQGADRDRLAILMDFLIHEYERASEALHQAMKEVRPC